MKTEHSIRILDRGQTIKRIFGDNISALTSEAISVMWGCSTGYLQVFIDDDYFNFPSADAGEIRKKMEKTMRKNRMDADFGIDDLFEV